MIQICMRVHHHLKELYTSETTLAQKTVLTPLNNEFVQTLYSGGSRLSLKPMLFLKCRVPLKSTYINTHNTHTHTHITQTHLHTQTFTHSQRGCWPPGGCCCSTGSARPVCSSKLYTIGAKWSLLNV